MNQRPEPERNFPAEAPDPDAVLHAACAAFHAAFEFERHSKPASDAEADLLGDATDQAFKLIVGLVPKTQAGLAAKASATFTRLLWQTAPRIDTPWRDQVSTCERAALECLAQVAGRNLP